MGISPFFISLNLFSYYLPYSRIHKHKSFCPVPSTRSSLGSLEQFSPEQDAWVSPDAYFDFTIQYNDRGEQDAWVRLDAYFDWNKKLLNSEPTVIAVI